ncbi:MAG: hypothetical protein KME09_08770 [Pleurocapsa minor HA4230-MV1]|jgi:hypothetical protein|nr:hypothetical protein [Pleurocapsa minor HA4230-MV1]
MIDSLSIEPTIHLENSDTYISREDDFKITFIRSLIKLNFEDEIGHITAYRFNLNYSDSDLTNLSEKKSTGLSYIASFFFLEEGKNEDLFGSIVYIDLVFIKPKYRGQRYAIQAVAMFLKYFACYETVCCFPEPTKDIEEKYPKEKGKLLMRRYWSKLGLNKYSAKQNILWTDEWSMPDWLREQIFSD